MAKLEDLPDEVILKVFGNLQFPDLLRCGRVSKRIKRVSNDKAVWENINLCRKRVPRNFLQCILAKDCKYLRLNEAWLVPEDLPLLNYLPFELELRSKLIELDLSWLKCRTEDIEVILASCHSLEKLSLADAAITSKMIHSISTQNGTTLQSLNLNICKGLGLESIQQILTQCVKLKEVNFQNTRLSEATENYLAEQMPSWVEKVDIGTLNRYFSDQNIMWIQTNCPKWFHYRMEPHRVLGRTCSLRVCIFHSHILIKRSRNISLVRIP